MSTSDNASKPKKTTVDGTTVEQHSLREQLDVERASDADQAAKAKHFGVRIGRFRHQGTGGA